MGLFDSKEVKEAKRQYKEEMRQLANSMQPTGKIFMCAKWDDNFRDVQVFEEVKAVTQTQGKEKKKGGITRALVGGVVAGPVGAIVGGMTAKTENNATSITSQQVTRTLVVTRDDPFNTVLSLPYNAKLEVKLRDILAANTTPAVETTTVEQIESQPVSIADEIVKLKELLDAGILTDEEFATQKAKLLK
ncbi:SHOCT domain-containing protein [Pseudolactococcus raffinolactis]|uniref:SHOCT domain-containing protein n=1 Tax=Pseudolactococcus raffinolactis TaxID=1366 RepID=UPI0014369C9B|nr:SHOCT domain-containing protein [Lactococcus raffinolactis]QIW52231.1 hypothetical protein GU337_10250 [Lactococcus raffinolactis]